MMSPEAATEISAMHAALGEFRRTGMDRLRLLIDELDVRVMRIAGVDPRWDSRFRESWEALEEVYAVMVDRGVETPDEGYKSIIDNALSRLKDLTN
jgi:hypothetical protein